MGLVAKTRRPLLWGSVGAALAYLCDPDRGAGRRSRIKDQVSAAVRRRADRLEQKTRYVGGKVQGVAARAANVGTSDEVPSDKALVDKVRSEVLGRAEFDGLDVVVDAADGVVTLRGEVAEASKVQDLERAVRKVDGVNSVNSLLHPPATSAPNKEAAREAS
ncbi:MAG: BON domain-containing protein [Actinomycetota bacterium]|nr:BON domain-containing protein [Actinomycetota bacterium]